MLVRLHKACVGITRHALWPLLGASLVALLLPSGQLYALSVLGALAFCAWMAGGRHMLSFPVLVAMGTLALMGWISLRITLDPVTTRWHVGRWWAGLLLVYGLAAWSRGQIRLDRLEMVSVLLSLGLVIAGAVWVQWPRGKLPFISQTLYAALLMDAQGLLNANMVAGALVMMLPFSLASALWATGRWRWVKRLVYGVVALLVLVELLLTQSRGAIAAAGLTLGVLFVARWPRLVFLVWPMVLIGSWSLAHTGFEAFLYSPVMEGAVSGFASRMDLWQRALQMLRDFPLTGVGAGLFERIMWALYPPTQIRPGWQAGLHAHNIWLQVGVDLGLPGLVAFVVLIVSSGQYAVRTLRRSNSVPPLLWGGLGALLAMVLHGLVDAPWLVGRAAFALWWTLAVVLSVSSKASEVAEQTA